MTEPEFEWGVEWTWRDGRAFVASPYTELGARTVVAASHDNEHNPRATNVMRRPVAEWLPVPLQPEGQATG